MSNGIINSKEKKEEYIQTWKYLSANGKLFIPVFDSPGSLAVYAEEQEKNKKIIRVFIDSEAIQVYLIEQQEKLLQTDPEAILKVGMSPVKTLQKKLSEVYGKEQSGDSLVECLLTTYDELGNIETIDVIWTQASN